MREDYTHLTLIVDRSGSMMDCWDDTVGGLKSIISKQKLEPGKLTVSLYAFDTSVDKVVSFCDITDVSEDCVKDLFPRGGTALYDALSVAVVQTGKALADLKEVDRPSKVTIVTLTDGGENSSREVTFDKLKDLINEQKNKYNWDFTFIGADFDSFEVAKKFGFNHNTSFNYAKNQTQDAFTNVINSGLSCYRSVKGQALNMAEYMKNAENNEQ
jgi:uncharacterized protein YegL